MLQHELQPKPKGKIQPTNKPIVRKSTILILRVLLYLQLVLLF